MVTSEGLYEVIGRRRDVRAEFNGAPVDPQVLDRMLGAAHTAPSVGMSQPWDFVHIRDRQTRAAFHSHVMNERKVFHDSLDGERSQTPVCLAIEDLWLAATAEGLGVGGVSFFQEPFLQALLDIPLTVRPIVRLCVGPVTELPHTPDLQRHGWRSPAPLASVVHYEHYDSTRA